MTCENTCENNFVYENRFHVLFGSQDYKHLDRTVIDITLPSINIGNTVQSTSIRDIYIPGTSVDFGEINMTFLLDENYTNYKTIFNWINRLRNFEEVNLERDIIDITVMLQDTQYKNVVEANFKDCFPFTISDIYLNQQIQDTEPVRFLVSFKINGFELQ